MRKTLLLAAAALAASVISSNAQVYSQNIVGYANLPAVTGGKNYLITCQFVMGVSNGINEVFGSSLPANSEILTWDPVASKFSVALYDPTDPAASGQPWYQGDDATPLSPYPTLPPGKGFFLVAATPTTNVFAGAIAINVGTSNNLVLPTGGKNYAVGCAVPYAGGVTNGTTSTGGPDLQNLPANSELLFWNYATSLYTVALYDPTDPAAAGTPWYQGDDATPYVDPSTGGHLPTIAVGQGFFIVPAAPYTWTTGL